MAVHLLVKHLLNFVAPAAMVALLLAGLARLFFGLFESKRLLAQAWWAQVAINFVVGTLVLVAGLVLLGRDGRMLTYVALLVAMAICQAWQLGGWKK